MIEPKNASARFDSFKDADSRLFAREMQYRIAYSKKCLNEQNRHLSSS